MLPKISFFFVDNLVCGVGWSVLDVCSVALSPIGDLYSEHNWPAGLASIQQTMPAESGSEGITLPIQLSWSHYERLIRVAAPEAYLAFGWRC